MEPQRHQTSESRSQVAHRNPAVGAYVRIGDGCPISYRVLDGVETEFDCGSAPDLFEFVLTAEALREFLRQGAEALADMDGRHPRREGTGTAPTA